MGTFRIVIYNIPLKRQTVVSTKEENRKIKQNDTEMYHFILNTTPHTLHSRSVIPYHSLIRT